MGFLNAKSIDQMMEEEELYEAQAARERARGSAEQERLLREARKRYGRDWRTHSENGKKSGLDWAALKFKVGTPGGRSIASTPRTGNNDINDVSRR